jgi:competence protein ComEC
MQKLRHYGAYICFALLAVIALSIWLRIATAPKAGELTVAILDIGQGDAIYIQSPTGIEVLIDGGPDSALLRELPTVMAYGDRTIDAVLATHPDADHIGGLVDLIPRYEIKNFIEPGIPKGTATAAKLQQEVDAAGIPRTKAYKGVWLELGGGASLEILFPDTDVSSLPDSKSNEGCAVARLTYKNSSALFMCDASFEVEDHLLATFGSTTLENDLLKVGHHGSKYSSGNKFLEAVAASVAVISAGTHNRYGHPTTEAMNRILAHGAQLFRTDLMGTIVFVSDGNSFIKK